MIVRRKKLVKQIKDVVNKSVIDYGDLKSVIPYKHYNFKISSYTPKEKVLQQSTEDRIHFDNNINIVYQGQFIPLAYRVTFTAGQDVKIHFIKTTRKDRRIISYFDLRERLRDIYLKYLNTDIEFWEVFAKIYIR